MLLKQAIFKKNEHLFINMRKAQELSLNLVVVGVLALLVLVIVGGVLIFGWEET